MIFVSYAEEDWKEIKAITRQSRKLVPRFRFFVAGQPDSVGSGAEWRSQLIRAMDAAEASVIFLSPVAAVRPWVNFELGYVTGRSTAPVLYFGLHNYRPDESSLPSAALQAIPLPNSINEAAKTLTRNLKKTLPAPPPRGQCFILIDDRTYPLNLEWSQYSTGGVPQNISPTRFGFAFGRSFDEGGFGFPSSGDQLTGPWKYIFVRSNPNRETNIYFVMDLKNGDRIKIFLSTRQEHVGWGLNPKNEFNIALPSPRPSDVLVDVASYLRLLKSEPTALKRILVRGPTELSAIGAVDSLTQIPAKFRRHALRLALAT